MVVLITNDGKTHNITGLDYLVEAALSIGKAVYLSY